MCERGHSMPFVARVLLMVSLIAFPALTFAQLSSFVASISPADAVSETPLVITVELREGEAIERVLFVYRAYGEGSWNRREMELRGNAAFVRLPAQVVEPPYLEHYLVLVKRSGSLESHPLSESSDPFERPPSRTLQMPVVRKEEDVQVMFLSPEPNATYEPADVLISMSLFRADSLVVRRATQILLDGADVTRDAVMTEDLFVYVPANNGVTLKPGRHRVSVLLFNREGKLHRQAVTQFYVSGEVEPLDLPYLPFVYTGSVDLESRNEKVNNAHTWYNRGGARFSGSQGDWRFNANVFVTSDELPSRQPQNRYYASLESQWLTIGYGDCYPNFPNLVLSGKRVRGLNTSLRFGKFNVDLALGQTVRGIEGALVKTIPADQLIAEQQADRFAAYARIDSLTWGKYTYGTYERDLFVVRPSFGSGEKYQIGFTWLKSKDDLSSIRFGTRPQENVVIGTDFVTRFDRNRIELSAQAAFSAFNSDISSGNFTDAYIDSVYKKDAQAIKDARDILKKFITVNDNLRPLSFKNLSTLAYDVALGLNYFENAFKATYLYRGSDFMSFGQTFLRTDIAGFNLLDRLRLPEQRLFLTLGYERLTDNTSKTKATTTRFTTVNVALTYDAPPELPSLSLGYAHFANVNDLFIDGPDSISAVNDKTNRYYLYAMQRFAWGAHHVATLGVSMSYRNDFTRRNLDVKNIAVTASINTRFTIPLQTTVGYALNVNEFPTGSASSRTRLNYSRLTLYGKYTFGQELVALTGSFNPTFGAFSRFTLDSSLQWNALRNMWFIVQYSYFRNQGLPDDDFWSLKYRLEY
ncbi:MAG: hypothetical protein C4326_01715 [Ignavibacteria bacterium]